MSQRQCKLCGASLFGRSDKRYCSATCRRDACRVRERTIRFGDYELLGREWNQSDSVERVLIPRLERIHGPNHREVHKARRLAERLNEEEWERMLARFRSIELNKQAPPE
jgi:hypothetical protein